MLALRPKTDSFATILNRIKVFRFHLVSVLTVEVPLDEEFLQMLSGKHLLAHEGKACFPKGVQKRLNFRRKSFFLRPWF